MKKYILLFGLTIQASISFAQNQNSSNDVSLEIENDTVKKKHQVIEEVVIISNLQKQAVKVGKSPIKALDLPQATAVIYRPTIHHQQLLRLSFGIKNAT